MTWSELFGILVDAATLVSLIVVGGPFGAIVAAAYVPAWLMWVVLCGGLAVVGLMAARLSAAPPEAEERE